MIPAITMINPARKVAAVLAKIYGSSRANRDRIRFICRATVLLYRGSVVTAFKRRDAQNKKTANKKLALAFCMDCLKKNGYQLQSSVMPDEIQELIAGELSHKKMVYWVVKYYRKV